MAAVMRNILIILGAITVFGGTVISVMIMRAQQNRELDKDKYLTSVKHPIMTNPILIAYALIPVLVFAIAAIVIYYF